MFKEFLAGAMKGILSKTNALSKYSKIITSDILKNMSEIPCTKAVVFLGDTKEQSLSDHGYMNEYGPFQINRNDLLKVSGVMDGIFTFENFGKMFGVKSNDLFCVYLESMESEVGIAIYLFEVDNNNFVEMQKSTVSELVSMSLAKFSGDKEAQKEVFAAIENIDSQ